MNKKEPERAGFKVVEAETIKRELPKNLSETDEYLFEKEFVRSFKAVYSQTFRNVLVLSNGAVVKKNILHNLYFSKYIPLKALVKIKSYIKLYLQSLTSYLRAKEKIETDRALFLTNFYSNNFYHWFGDVLQTLEALDIHPSFNLTDYTLVVPRCSTVPVVNETLRAYNVPYTVVEPHQIVEADQLLHIPQVTPTGNFRPRLMRNMRTRFLQIQNADVQKPTERIFISRANAASRTIVNERDLFPILKKHQFRIVFMEQLSFREQVQTIAKAEYVVGAHGAGLTHMLWMSEKTHVLEIRVEDDTHNNLYYSLASSLNLHYYYLQAKSTDTNLSTQKTDLTVDPVLLDETLQNMLDSG